MQDDKPADNAQGNGAVPPPAHDEGSLALLIDEHEELVSEDGRKVRRRGIFLLPNLLTTGAMFAGFYGVISGMNGEFRLACIAILAAMVLDGLDGRVARLTNTQSAFGAQYDSLSDLVAFGVAPALICFSWALSSLGKIGWTVAFLYMACAALRLARFNVQISTVDKRYFVGLASPSAAGLVVFMVWTCYEFGVAVTPLVSVMAGVVTALAGILMILSLRYYSFKDMDFKNRVPFFVMLLVVLVFVVVSLNPPVVLFTIAVLYALSGPAMFVTHYRRRRREKAAEAGHSAQ